MRGPAFFAYSTNYLIDTQHAVILDVEATRAIRQPEVGAARTMLIVVIGSGVQVPITLNYLL